VAEVVVVRRERCDQSDHGERDSGRDAYGMRGLGAAKGAGERVALLLHMGCNRSR